MKEEYYAKKKPCLVVMLILNKKVKRKENNISQFVEVYKKYSSILIIQESNKNDL